MKVLTDVQRIALGQPIEQERVKQREGAKGRRLSYIETWDAKRVANEVFGYGNWGYEIMELVDLGIENHRSKEGREGHRIAYRCRLRLEVMGCLPIEDVGYGEDLSYTSVLQSHELASKEAVSDALKRCLVAYGDQFGLGLYDKDAPEHRGRSSKPAAPRTGSESPPTRRRGTTTKLRASQIALMKAAKDAGLDDDLRHRIIFMLTSGQSESVKDLDDEQCDQIRAQIVLFGENIEGNMPILEAWEAKQ